MKERPLGLKTPGEMGTVPLPRELGEGTPGLAVKVPQPREQDWLESKVAIFRHMDSCRRVLKIKHASISIKYYIMDHGSSTLKGWYFFLCNG